VQADVFVWHNQKPLQSINTSFASFSPFCKGVEEKGNKPRIKEDHGAVDITSSE